MNKFVELNMSIVYCVVQFSFLHACSVAIPFVDTGTKNKIHLHNYESGSHQSHQSKVKVNPHVCPHFLTIVTASLKRIHEVQYVAQYHISLRLQ